MVAFSPIVVDASAVLAVILDEPQRNDIVRLTLGTSLSAPGSMTWEIGNALIAGFRRRRLDAASLQAAWEAFEAIEIQIADVAVPRSLELAAEHGLYAYDGYVLELALRTTRPLLTLERALAKAARRKGVALLELSS